jgi:uncharacterized protein (TIGR03437 family)
VRKRTIRVFKSAAAAAVPLTLLAFSTGPPIKRTGAPVDGGVTCTACHTSFPLNDASGGSLAIHAVPYTPGVKQTVTVRVNHPTGLRFGFQLTARLTSDETKEAGTFAENDSVQVKCDPTGTAPCNGALEFAEHTQPATGAGLPGPRVFTVEWTPPATDAGPVVFYAAGNAGNNSSSNAGDHIYNTKLIIPSSIAPPKPAISQDGVRNGASETPGCAPNGWIQIKGTNLNLNTRIWQEDDFVGTKLPIQLEGTSVKINGKDAFIYYISPTQINALVPVDDTVGNVSVQVTTNGVTSDSFTAQLQRIAPAFFVYPDGNIKSTHGAGGYVGPTTLIAGLTTPAKPGETIVLWGSGFGNTTPGIPNGEIVTTASNLATPVTIRIGGVDVTPDLAALTAAGVYQFNVKIPDSTPDGDVPVIATINSISTQSSARIRVQR